MASRTPRLVFVSHTSELAKHPQGRPFLAATTDAITAAGDVPVHMGQFGARAQPPASVCIAEVRRCSVWVGLIGLRYGSPVRDNQQLSYTELEFDTATDAGMERLCFLVDDEVTGLPASAVIDRPHGVKQDAFRQRLLESGIVTREFRTADEIERLVYAGLLSCRSDPAQWPALTLADHREELARELDLIRLAATSQGWEIRKDTPSVLWILHPSGRKFTLTIGQADITRSTLRRFALELNAAGLRINRSLLVPIDQPPASPFES